MIEALRSIFQKDKTTWFMPCMRCRERAATWGGGMRGRGVELVFVLQPSCPESLGEEVKSYCFGIPDIFLRFTGALNLHHQGSVFAYSF